MRDILRGKRMKGLTLENEALKEKIGKANTLLSQWLPHKCWTCAHSYYNSGEKCQLAHYTDKSWDCLSWIYNPL